MLPLNQTFLVVGNFPKKYRVEQAVADGMRLYEEKYGRKPTLLAISPDVVYTVSTELTVIQDSLVPPGTYYFGEIANDADG